MNELLRPVLLASLGMYFRPLAAMFPVYRKLGAESLSQMHCFIVEYGVNKDKKLNFHVDDSEITFNLSLGAEFEGGDLFFGGHRCNEHVNAWRLVLFSHFPFVQLLKLTQDNHPNTF